MPPCKKCNFPLPEPCVECPPRFFICPNCGEEQLLEPSAEAVAAYLRSRELSVRVRRDIENLGEMRDLLAKRNNKR